MKKRRREGEPEGPDCQITVVFPTPGKAMRWDRARFTVFYHPEHGIAPTLFTGEVGTGPVEILDPRVIIFNDSTVTVDYSPRHDESQQADWVRDWLRLHPNWGLPGCEADWATALQGVE